MKATEFNAEELWTLRQLVQARTGLTFPESRMPDLEAGVRRAMTGTGSVGLIDFMGRIDTDPHAFDVLIANITVAETYFFREPAQFQVLRDLVLPDLRNRISPGVRLRVWSAGCASGEEPYSLAILLEEEGFAASASVLGTDISRAALERAREASYGTWSLRGSRDERTLRCFERRGDRHMLLERLRARVDFKYLNLASDAYPAPEAGIAGVDLVLCRNVLIYFDPETVRRVARKLFDSLRIGGWLVTGPSDPPLWDSAPYRTIVTPAGVLYRRDDGGGSARLEVCPEQSTQHNTHFYAVPHLAPAPSSDHERLEPPIEAAASAPTLAPERSEDPESRFARIRALADRGMSRDAETEVLSALCDYPTYPQLHFMHAVVSIELGHWAEAATSLRRVSYLDPTLATAHFTLGTVLQRLGFGTEACRSYQNALDLCLEWPAEHVLPLSDGRTAGELIEAARDQIVRLARVAETTR